MIIASRETKHNINFEGRQLEQVNVLTRGINYIWKGTTKVTRKIAKATY